MTNGRTETEKAGENCWGREEDGEGGGDCEKGEL